MWGYLVMETLGLFLPSMREELNLTPVREGLLGAAPQLTVLILSIPFGLYLSRFPPKLLTLVSIVGAVCVIFFQAWAPVYGFVLLARLLYGLSITLREPARTLLLRMWIKPRQILIANASIELLWGIGAALFHVGTRHPEGSGRRLAQDHAGPWVRYHRFSRGLVARRERASHARRRDRKGK